MSDNKNIPFPKPPNSQNNPPKNHSIDDSKITKDELKNILKAMDKDGFDKIMEEYMKEISDPNNITETNQYLRECMERKDLPANVKLVQPNEGFVIKSTKFSIKKPGIRHKVFINLVSLKEINPPEINEKTRMCSLPHLLNKQRNDQDKKGNICYTFDVAFNPDAFKRAGDNMAFKKYICDTAINGINNNILKSTQEKISNDYIIKTKLKYKGIEISLMNINTVQIENKNGTDFSHQLESAENYKTQIQKEIDDLKNKKNEDNDEEDKIFDKPDLDCEISQKEIDENKKNFILEENKKKNVKPEYKIKYSDDVQLHKYFYSPNNFKAGDQYSKLIIDITVPRIENINLAEVELDEKKLNFKYTDVYILEIDLPVCVDKNTSDAKFDRHRGLLSISAIIVRKYKEELRIKEDENIEIVKSDEEEEKKIEEEKNIEIEKNLQKVEDKKFEEKKNLEKLSEEKKIPELIKEEKNLDQKNVEQNLEKLEFNKKIKQPINLDLNSKNEKNKNVNENNSDIINNDENILSKKEFVTEMIKENIENEEDDIESGTTFTNTNNTENNGFRDRSLDNENNVTNPENSVTTKKTFERKEISQLTFLNFNCPWIYDIE